MKWWIMILVILMAGCCTQKRCLTKYPSQTIIERSDTTIYRNTIIYRDRVVWDTIQADTQFMEVVIPVNIPLPSDTAKAENDYAIAKAWLENKKLKLELQQKEQVIERRLANVEIERKYWEQRYIEETRKETRIEYKKRPINKFTFWFTIVTIILFLSVIGWKLAFRKFTFVNSFRRKDE